MNHLAIIMDGNGRWAKQRLLPRSAGHKKGAQAARAIIEAAAKAKISHLTLYTFSSENWSRPQEEVQELMNLLRYYLNNELKSLHKEGVKLRIIGDTSKLDTDIQQKIAEAEALTRQNTAIQLNLALSYGSRAEIVQAVAALAQDMAAGKLAAQQIDEKAISDRLYTAGIPDPDLLIRTGGEQRISNFLLWQMAYTELYFTDTLWPDFTAQDLQSALEDFAARERRFGATENAKKAV